MKSKKALIIAILVIAVAAAVVLGFTMKPAEKAEHDYFLVNQGDTVLVMDAFNPEEVVAEFESNKISQSVFYSSESSAIITTEKSDNYDEFYEGEDLIYYNISSSKKEIIANYVSSYVATNDLKHFLYIDACDGSLYKKSRSDEGRTFITDDADSFYMSDDAETIIFVNSKNETYLKNDKNDPVLLGKNITIKHFDRTNGNFIYTKGTELIINTAGTEKVITTNFFEGEYISPIGDCDTFYFSEKQEEFSVFSLFEDDLKETLNLSDKEIEEFNSLLNNIFDEDYSVITLCKYFYYDHGTITEVCDDVLWLLNNTSRSPIDKVAAVFECFDTSLKTKIKLSDIYYTTDYEIYSAYNNLYSKMNYYTIAKKDTIVKEIKDQIILDCKYNYSSNEMYLCVCDTTDDIDVDSYKGDIIKISLDINNNDIITVLEDKQYIGTASYAEPDELLYTYFEDEKVYFGKDTEILAHDLVDYHELLSAFYLAINENGKEKGLIYFNGKIHDYPDIDLINNDIRSTQKGNIIVYDDDYKYFYIINNDTEIKFDKPFDSLTIVDTNTPYYSTSDFNYYDY